MSNRQQGGGGDGRATGGTDVPLLVAAGQYQQQQQGKNNSKAADAQQPAAAAGHKLTSRTATFVNLIKGNIGTGILSLPHAMTNAGLVIGTAGLAIVGFLITYCMHQLLAVYRKVQPSRPNRQLDYADVAEAAFEDAPIQHVRSFSRAAKHIINAFIVITQIGACCIYLNFCPQMVRSVVESYSDFKMSITLYQAATTALLIPYCFVRTLHVLAIFSMIANLLTIGSLLVILQYVFRNLQLVENTPLVPESNEKIFLYLGSVLFAYESITLVIPFESKMKDRHSFHGWDGLMSVSMVVIIALYTGVAFYGYLAFGADAKLILKNMPNHWVYNAIKIIYAACIFMSYNLQLFVAIEILWPPLQRLVGRVRFLHDYGEYFLRTFLVLLTFGLAALVPCLEEMISLVGSLAMPSLGLIFPPILEIIAFLPGSGNKNKNNNKLETGTQLRPLNDAAAASAAGHHHHHHHHHHYNDHPAPGDISNIVVKNRRRQAHPPGAIVASFPEEEEVSRGQFTLIVIRGVTIFLIGIAASTIGTYLSVSDIAEKLTVHGTC